jgi:hypothetical protein
VDPTRVDGTHQRDSLGPLTLSMTLVRRAAGEPLHTKGDLEARAGVGPQLRTEGQDS